MHRMASVIMAAPVVLAGPTVAAAPGALAARPLAARPAESVGPAAAGVRWRAIVPPTPPDGKGSSPSQVACQPTSSTCVVTGSYYQASTSETQGMLLTWNGRRWHAVTAPLPPDAAASPSDPLVSLGPVACLRARTCVAAGSYTDTGGTVKALFLTGHGRGWTAAAAALPANTARVDWSAIACTPARSCVAAGSYADSSGNGQPLLVTGYGHSWNVVKVALPTGPDADYSDVACASECAVTGFYYDSSSGINRPLLVTGRGSSWTAITAPLPADAPGTYGTLAAVACPSATTCVAVGDYGPGAMAVTGHGTTWTATSLPLPSSAGQMSDVACPTASTCTAVSAYASMPSGHTMVLLTRHGPAWATAHAQIPPRNDGAAFLWSVTCPATTSCVAAGYYSNSVGEFQGMLVTGHHNSWTAIRAPEPAGALNDQEALVTNVACASVTVCAAIGHYTGQSGAGAIMLLLAGQR